MHLARTSRLGSLSARSVVVARRPFPLSFPKLVSIRPTRSESTSLPIACSHPIQRSFSTRPPPSVPQLITWPAGSYEIALLVDTRETIAESGMAAFENLQATELNVEKRSLVLGDMLWVAKRTDAKSSSPEDNDEVVLGFVVERKRMDDVVNSTLDGRFRDQKARLRQSGMEHVSYLMEEFESAYDEQRWSTQITSTMTSLQALDKTILKRTMNPDDTLDSLRVLDQTVRSFFENKPLNIIPDSAVTRQTYESLRSNLTTSNPHETYLTTYSTYNKLNKRSRSDLTPPELLSRMLRSIDGISAPKADAIVEVHPTLQLLWKAFEQAEQVEKQDIAASAIAKSQPNPTPSPKSKSKSKSIGSEKKAESVTKTPKKRPAKIRYAKHMLVATVKGVGRRKIGDILSEKVYDLFKSMRYNA
ncbi:Endonuclease MUS81 [Phaffia rhodozyma]|uniref:Crossover junction endonuclease MUS81 n=1 Tax=Phaffia rhodozyma TaxID=264483 RepID=A0A0F7SL44_PHARH|nr:Endonuclease MUS81 [Phaffia rhodozyma]